MPNNNSNYGSKIGYKPDAICSNKLTSLSANQWPKPKIISQSVTKASSFQPISGYGKLLSANQRQMQVLIIQSVAKARAYQPISGTRQEVTSQLVSSICLTANQWPRQELFSQSESSICHFIV